MLNRFFWKIETCYDYFPHRSAPEECPLNDGNLLNVRLFVKVAYMQNLSSNAKIFGNEIGFAEVLENTFPGLGNVLEVLSERSGL